MVRIMQLLNNTPNIYFVDDDFLNFKAAISDNEFSPFLNDMIEHYNYLRVEIAFCHKDIDKLFERDEKLEKMEKTLKKLKGANYNNFSKQLIALVNAHHEKLKRIELQIISDLNNLIEDIYYLSHYVLWSYDSFSSSPTLEEILFTTNAHLNKVLEPFNQNFEIKKDCESIFELFKAFYCYKNKDTTLAINYYNNAKALSYMPDFGGIVQSFNIGNGKKGGMKKGENLEPVRQKVLAHHDRYFTEKKENGKFLYSHAKTARMIIKELKIDCYSENSLANIIAEHRKNYFTP